MAGSVSGLHVFAGDTGPEALSLLDTNYSSLTTVINSLSTYSNYYVDSGGANALVVTVPSPQQVAYSDGLLLQVNVAANNTGATTINVNGLGLKSIVNPSGSALAANQLIAGGIAQLQYSGAMGKFQLVGFSGSSASFTNLTVGPPAAGTALTVLQGSVAAAIASFDSTAAAGSFITLTNSGTSYGYLGSVASLLGSGSASDLAIRAQGAWQLLTGGAAQRVVVSSTGNVTVNAPSSGDTLTVNALVGGNVLRASDGTAISEWLSNGSSGIYFGTISSHQGQLGTAGATRVTVSNAGAVTVNAPSSGTAFTATGAAGSYVALLQGSGTTGQSQGLHVLAGTNASDFGVVVANASGSTNYFLVRGDGLVQAVDQGGTLQDVGWRGTPINSQSVSYTPGLSDRGKIINFGGTSGLTLHVQTGVFSGGDAYSVRIAAGATATISQDAGMTLLWAGNGSTTGSRTLTGEGLATIVYLDSTHASIGGAGLS